MIEFLLGCLAGGLVGIVLGLVLGERDTRHVQGLPPARQPPPNQGPPHDPWSAY